MAEDFVNKVATNGILTLDLLEYKPNDLSVGIDIADFLPKIISKN